MRAALAATSTAGHLHDGQLVELGQVGGDRVVEPEASRIDQPHQADGGDALRHRRETEDRVWAKRLETFRVGVPVGTEVEEAVAVPDHRHRTWDRSGRDGCCEDVVDGLNGRVGHSAEPDRATSTGGCWVSGLWYRVSYPGTVSSKRSVTTV